MKLKKSLGQHFLKDKGIVKKIVDSLNLSQEDKVIEIGGGGGALTEELLKRNPKELVVLEIDDEWCSYLSSKFPGVKVIRGDATSFDFSSLGDNGYKFVGNLPYNVSTAILRNLLNYRHLLVKGTFMVQKEVADRLTSTSGKNYGYFPALLSLFFSIKKLFNVPPRSFYPPPKVVSTVFSLEPKDFDLKEKELLEYERFLKKAFSHRRKKLKKNLEISELGEFGEKRAEEIPPETLFGLFKKLKKLSYSF